MTYRRSNPMPEHRTAPRQGHHREPPTDAFLDLLLAEADYEAGLHRPATGVGTRSHRRTEKTARRAVQYTPLTNNWS